jgi:nicotinamide-nucleotide adenylyltransferase
VGRGRQEERKVTFDVSGKDDSRKLEKTVGVYWGRFNPPHRGHIALIRRLVKKVDYLIIAIGNAEVRNTKRNPFSGAERAAMMKSYLRERGIRVWRVVEVKDGDTWPSSISNLFERCGRFDVLFTDHEVIANLIGARAKVVAFKRRGKVSSTLIRDYIARGKKWETLTGRSVVTLIRQYDGINRIRRAYEVTE